MNFKLPKVLLLVFVVMFSCQQKKSENPVSSAAPQLKNWAWTYINPGLDDNAWKQKFDTMKTAGIDGILLLRRDANMNEFERVARIGKKAGLEIHVWITFLNPHNSDSIAQVHPEWYVVSRNGESCLDKPPYIPSYKWLCPSRPEVKDFLVKFVSDLAKLDYVDGVHLDYVRYPDVILPVGIQPEYNLAQDKEFPEYDFCYCDVCRKKFKEQSGIDPMDLPDPPSNQAWVNYRYQTVTDLVNMAYDAVHKEGKKLTAAVFPTPDLAKKLVRQDWTHWKIDALMPMMYHQYYLKTLDWVEEATKEGTTALADSIPLYSGLFVNEIKPKEFVNAVKYVTNGGGSGLCLFNANGMTGDKWKALQKALGR